LPPDRTTIPSNEVIYVQQAPGGVTVRERVHAIDYLKAAAIVTVVWIHAFVSFDLPPTRGIYLLGRLSLFAVPAFFFASGFLYHAVVPIPWSETRRHLVRVLVPYLVASLAAQVYTSLQTDAVPSAGKVLRDVAMGSSIGIYYFVPVFVVTVFLAMILSRIPRSVPLLFLLLWILGLLTRLQLLGSDLFWMMRSPQYWWGFFLAGWIAAPLWPRLAAVPLRTRALISAPFGIVLVGFLVFLLEQTYWGWTPSLEAFGYLNVYALIGLIAIGARALPAHRAIRWLSDASYPLYLYHYFFTEPVRLTLAGSPWARGLPAWAAGLAGAALLCLAAPRVLGRRLSWVLLGLRASETGHPREAGARLP
jgi:peptidoglycan/LPS O-acetylase OafA/YrhL